MLLIISALPRHYSQGASLLLGNLKQRLFKITNGFCFDHPTQRYERDGVRNSTSKRDEECFYITTAVVVVHVAPGCLPMARLQRPGLRGCWRRKSVTIK
jgi:hypothetical protein